MKDKEKLDSWKDISRYLQRDVRTCQRWEKELGLPVHRLEGTTRPRVFAYTREINAWIKEKHAYRFEGHGPGRTAARLKILGFAALVILIPVMLLVLKPAARPGFPVDFKIVDSRLIMLDAEDRELWEFDSGLGNLESEEMYHKHFQTKHLILEDTDQPYILIEDINADGSPEVLFSIQTLDEMQEGILYCFSNQGKMLWTFDAGRRMVFGDTEYSSAYRIHGLRADDWDGDGLMEILCVATHGYRFPCRVLLLDHYGEIRGEYCHSGYFTDYEFIDLDVNGRKEIVLTGMNNEWQAACCAVLDPGLMTGASFQNEPEYSCRSLERGTEKYYLRFPHCRLAKRNAMSNCIRLITFSDKDRRLTLTTDPPQMIFELNYRLEFVSLTLTHFFKIAYDSWAIDKHPRPSLEEIRQEILDEGIQYLSGEEWSPIPSLNPLWHETFS